MPGPEPRAEESASTSVAILRAIGSLLLRIPRRWAFLPAILWAGLIFVASSQPAPSIGGDVPFLGLLENFAHALVYGVLAVWLALAAPRRGGWVELRPPAVAAILLAVLLYGASDEWHQSFTPGREATALDVVTNVAGAVATLACIAALGRGHSAGRALWIRIALGLFACLAAAYFATYGPELLGGTGA